MKKVRRVATGLIFLFILVPNVWAANVVGQYFIDRGNDFVDIFRFRIGIPHKAHAFGVKARVTTLAQIGCVWFEGTHYGIDRRAVGSWKESRIEGGLSALYGTSVQNEVHLKDTFKNSDDPWTELNRRGIVRNNVYWDDGRHHPLSIGAELQTGILPGLDLGLYPGELLDFVAGIFTIDFWDDDGAYVKRREKEFEEIAARTEQLEKQIAEEFAETADEDSEKAIEMENKELMGHQGEELSDDYPQPVVPVEMVDIESEVENEEILPETIDENETTPVIVPTPAPEADTTEQPEAAVEINAPAPEERTPPQSKVKPDKHGATTRTNLPDSRPKDQKTITKEQQEDDLAVNEKESREMEVKDKDADEAKGEKEVKPTGQPDNADEDEDANVEKPEKKAKGERDP